MFICCSMPGSGACAKIASAEFDSAPAELDSTPKPTIAIIPPRLPANAKRLIKRKMKTKTATITLAAGLFCLRKFILPAGAVSLSHASRRLKSIPPRDTSPPLSPPRWALSEIEETPRGWTGVEELTAIGTPAGLPPKICPKNLEKLDRPKTSVIIPVFGVLNHGPSSFSKKPLMAA